MATLDIENLAKRFGAVTVIPDLSLSVAEGEFLFALVERSKKPKIADRVVEKSREE